MAYTIYKYLRISAEDIDLDGFDKFESNSIANQRALLDDFIGRMPEFAGCEVMEELDDGRSGTNFSRPGVQRLIGLAQAGKAQCIVVKDLSRWGRNYIEVGDFLEQKFPEWGVRFISLNDAYDSAMLNGATGGIDIAFRNLIYHLYSQDLSEKVRTAKASAAKSGLSLDRPGLQSLIGGIQEGKIKTVIAADMCRIARGSLPMGEWVKIIKKHGIEFISVSDGFRFPDDDKWFGVLTFLANLATHKT